MRSFAYWGDTAMTNWRSSVSGGGGATLTLVQWRPPSVDRTNFVQVAVKIVRSRAYSGENTTLCMRRSGRTLLPSVSPVCRSPSSRGENVLPRLWETNAPLT